MDRRRKGRKFTSGVFVATITALALDGFLASAARAQDTRDVQEPKVPPICQGLNASLKADAGEPRESAEASLDTRRLQAAIDYCQSEAVALQPHLSKAQYALYLRGLKEAPIEDVLLSDCEMKGVEKPNVIENVTGLVLRNVHINGKLAGEAG